MTRKEEIDKEANSFANTVSLGEQEIAKTWSAFMSGAEWADKTMLDKVCEWLEDNIYDYLYINRDFNEADYKHELIEDLRKAMEEKVMITQEMTQKEKDFFKERFSMMDLELYPKPHYTLADVEECRNVGPGSTFPCYVVVPCENRPGVLSMLFGFCEDGKFYAAHVESGFFSGSTLEKNAKYFVRLRNKKSQEEPEEDINEEPEENNPIVQEEIGYTKEEISAMMKTIQELRKEKKEWIEKAFEFFNKKLYLYREYEEDLDGVGRTFEFLTCDYDTTDEFNEAFKKHMEQ